MAKLRLPASRSGKVLVIIGGVLVLCICGFVGSAALAGLTSGGRSAATAQPVAGAVVATPESRPAVISSPTVTREATETSAPTSTPAPSETARPTEVPATSTPEPVPTDAPTVAPRFSAEEIAYTAQVAKLMGTMSTAVTTIGEQSTAAGGNPLLLRDESWQTLTVLALATLQVSAKELRDLDAPARFAGVQRELKDAARHFIDSTELYADGVDHLDAEKLGAASQQLSEGTAAMQRANAELKKIDAVFE